jgi:hypothetical protein
MRRRNEFLLLVSVLLAAPLVAQTTARTANAPAKPVVSAPAHKTTPTLQAKSKIKKREAAKKADPEKPVTPPPPPPTPEQMAPAPPQVSYQNGQLTIQSQNSTLADILNAVRRQTGTQMDVPPGAASQRIATRLGPGAPQDVLRSLLNGSKFDYIILGSANTPGGVQRLILTPRTGGPATAPAVSQNPPMQGNAAAPEPESGDEEQPMVEDNPPEPMEPEQGTPEQAQPEQPQPGPGQPIGQPASGISPQPGQPVQPQPGQPIQQAQPNTEQQQDNQGQPQVKTPEQLLQELQRMQQQQQQQQQQQPPQ